MKYPDNIEVVAALKPDYMGFIFYEKSKRYVGEALDENVLQQLPASIKKVGVFVNQSGDHILSKVTRYKLDLIQLHGDESPEQCAELKKAGCTIIKVFQTDSSFDFSMIEPFKKYADYFLFDTKSPSYGGTGEKFDWEIFKKYDNETPLFLSGGLDIESVEAIKKLDYLNIHALDINSKFETEPGRKKIELVNAFMSAFL